MLKRALAALVAAAALTLAATVGSDAASGSIYHSPVYGWSIAVPEDWQTDDSDVAGVVFAHPDGIGAISVNVGEVHAAGLDALAEDFVALLKAMARDRDIPYEVLDWQPGKLADGTEFVEIEDRVGEAGGDGGRTLMRLFLAARTATIVVGESDEADWREAEPALTAAVHSFHPGESTVLTAAAGGSLLSLVPHCRQEPRRARAGLLAYFR